MYFRVGDDAAAFLERIHRTWLTMLIEANYREVAALLADAEITIEQTQWSEVLWLELPHSAFLMAKNDDAVRNTIESTLSLVCEGYCFDQNDNKISSFQPEYRLKLLELSPDWRDVIKNLIANAKDPNQGYVTELMFRKRSQPVVPYNEMKFGSQSEIRIAQELERRKVLFFPLPLAVRADTGENWKDHKEPDFVICDKGKWGVLEVSRHEGRYEVDVEKREWFETSGILCYRPYTAERCFTRPAEVVDDFLQALAKF